jgi:hypothetical protein
LAKTIKKETKEASTYFVGCWIGSASAKEYSRQDALPTRPRIATNKTTPIEANFFNFFSQILTCFLLHRKFIY